ncbi:glycosyltransferase [Candidatus Pelagibacter sp.]|nr:glycosyltransferase [Candidatus Pelagibacter sp.]
MIKDNISAIIPVHKPCNIDKTLQSINEIVDEIIIINSSAEEISFSDTKIKVFNYTEKLNASRSRNLGIENSTKEILLFIDSDVVLTEKGKSFVKNLKKLDDNEIIGGVYSNDKDGKIISNINSSILKYRFLKGNKVDESAEFFSSSHFLVKKRSIQDIGAFNEFINFWEDVDISFRSKIFETKIKIDSDFESIHLKEYNFINHLTENLKKTYNASKIKISNLNLYKGAKGQLPFKILLYLKVVPIGILSMIITNNLYIVATVLLLTTVALSVINYKIYNNFFYSLVASIYMGFTTPLLLISNIMGKISFFINRIKMFVLELYDYFLCTIKVIIKNGKPIQFIQYVTARCNLRCDHCFYKETLDKKDKGEISSDLLISTANDMGPLLWYSLAGGEPFIRKDLGEIISKIQEQSRPKILSLPTNGWYTKKTFKSVLEVMQRTTRGNFLVFFSIDGRNASHDEIRGPNSYEKLQQTYELLSKLRKIYPRLYLNIIITVQPKNYNMFPELIDEIYEEFNPTSISVNLLRYHYKDAEKLDPKIIQGYEKALEGYEKLRNKNGYGFFWNAIIKAKEKKQKELILKVATKDEFVTPCSAGNLSYVGMEDGSVKACEILPDVVGNLYKDKTNDIFKNQRSIDLRKEIVKTKCRCTYECAMSTNTLFNFDQQKELVKQSVKDVLKL